MRSFQNRPGGLFALSAIMLILVAGCFLWHKLAVPGTLMMLVALIYIERTIHTKYVITNEPSEGRMLIISHGRLSTPECINLNRIGSVQLVRPTHLFFLIPRPEVVVIYLMDKCHPLMLTPSNPEAFIKVLNGQK